MSEQLQLALLPANPKPLNLTGVVHDVMRNGEWITLYQLQRIVDQRFGEWHSDAGLSARVRDLRKPQYGSHVVERRRRVGTNSWEYRLKGKAQ